MSQHDASPDLIQNLSKDKVAAPSVPNSSIPRQAQDEDFGETSMLCKRQP
jgi:hypothetical protein